MIKNYQKKPVIISAIQFTGDNTIEVLSFCNKNEIIACNVNDQYISINTLEGEMKANIKDYVIRGIKGEFYPCKPDIFDATYEEVICQDQAKQ